MYSRSYNGANFSGICSLFGINFQLHSIRANLGVREFLMGLFHAFLSTDAEKSCSANASTEQGTKNYCISWRMLFCFFYDFYIGGWIRFLKVRTLSKRFGGFFYPVLLIFNIFLFHVCTYVQIFLIKRTKKKKLQAFRIGWSATCKNS
jgi:hypothetical protein